MEGCVSTTGPINCKASLGHHARRKDAYIVAGLVLTATTRLTTLETAEVARMMTCQGHKLTAVDTAGTKDLQKRSGKFTSTRHSTRLTELQWSFSRDSHSTTAYLRTAIRRSGLENRLPTPRRMKTWFFSAMSTTLCQDRPRTSPVLARASVLTSYHLV